MCRPQTNYASGQFAERCFKLLALVAFLASKVLPNGVRYTELICYRTEAARLRYSSALLQKCDLRSVRIRTAKLGKLLLSDPTVISELPEEVPQVTQFLDHKYILWIFNDPTISLKLTNITLRLKNIQVHFHTSSIADSQ